MIQISYISSATSPASTQDLLGLLAQCRQSNSSRGITGMLLYANGTYLQVLEGEQQAIDELVEKIKRDPRHTDIRMLHRKPIERRQYSDWSMGFKKVSDKDLRQVEGLEGFGESAFNAEYLARHGGVVESLMSHYRKERLTAIGQSELGIDHDDRMINALHRVIRGAVRVLAVLMVVTILWGVIDVIMVLYGKILLPSVQDLRPRDIILVFGAFLAVLIAIEIFMNITLYLRDDVVHVRLVVATALIAIARKVIILDFEKIEPMYIFATATVVLALGIVYWLMNPRSDLGLKKPAW